MNSKRKPIWLSFLVPILIVLIYFSYRGMAPFGKSTLLTADLGQQYIDFFAYFHNTVLHNPSAIFYSFSKALGGDMLGTWSYYLLSPLNILLLFFPISKLPSAVLIITALKYGLSGLSFGYIATKLDKIHGPFIPMFATIYALMGWIVAYQFNIIWLDGLIFLPLIFYGLLKLLNQQSMWFYIWSLAFMLMINYYIAYMICLFIALYTFVNLYPTDHNFKLAFKKLFRWIKASIISFLISAWITIPTIISLMDSKISNSHAKLNFLGIEYFPLNFLGKFVNGTVTFKQLPYGTPNIFVGSLVILLFIYYFLSSQFSKVEKIRKSIITLFILISMVYQPLDLLWHAMQKPIWYPYRFSFVLSFWMIVTAIEVFAKIYNDKLEKRPFIISCGAILLGLLYIFLAKLLGRLTYLKFTDYIYGIVYMGITISLMFYFNTYKTTKPFKFILFILVVSEMGLNLFTSLNNLTYLQNSEYENYIKMIKKPTDQVAQKDKSFYREGFTFLRTRNDPFSGNYHGGSLFSSTLEHNVANFFSNTGNQASRTTVAYNHATLFTDSLLSMKYYFDNQNVPFENDDNNIKYGTRVLQMTNHPDINNFNLISDDHVISTYENPRIMPIAFVGQNKNAPIYRNLPIVFQDRLAEQIMPSEANTEHPLFTRIVFPKLSFNNIVPFKHLNQSLVHKQFLLNDASISFIIKAKPHTSYYMTLGGGLSAKEVSFNINGVDQAKFPGHKHAIIFNLASTNAEPQNVKVTLNFHANDVLLSNVKLYKLPVRKITKISKHAQNNKVNITNMSSRSISGKVNVKKPNQAVLTTIPYTKGWHTIVDGKKVPTHTWAETFLKIPLSKGTHTIKLYYIPKGFIFGSTISIITILTMIGFIVYKKRIS